MIGRPDAVAKTPLFPVELLEECCGDWIFPYGDSPVDDPLASTGDRFRPVNPSPGVVDLPDPTAGCPLYDHSRIPREERRSGPEIVEAPTPWLPVEPMEAGQRSPSSRIGKRQLVIITFKLQKADLYEREEKIGPELPD